MIPSFIESKKHKDLDNDFKIDFYELSKDFNFNCKRVYLLESNSKNINRGNHAHQNQSQILILTKGSAIVELTNQKGVVEEWELIMNKLFLIPKNYWVIVKMQRETVIYCLATKPYEKLKTIKDKNTFLSKQIC